MGVEASVEVRFILLEETFTADDVFIVILKYASGGIQQMIQLSLLANVFFYNDKSSYRYKNKNIEKIIIISHLQHLSNRLRSFLLSRLYDPRTNPHLDALRK